MSIFSYFIIFAKANKYKSDDYKLGAVKYYLKQNDSMDKVCKIFDLLKQRKAH